jgi:hypothetical protein
MNTCEGAMGVLILKGLQVNHNRCEKTPASALKKKKREQAPAVQTHFLAREMIAEKVRYVKDNLWPSRMMVYAEERRWMRARTGVENTERSFTRGLVQDDYPRIVILSRTMLQPTGCTFLVAC